MRQIVAGSLGLLLGLLTAEVHAGDPSGLAMPSRRVIASSTAPIGSPATGITLGRPEPVSLGRPIALQDNSNVVPGRLDGTLRPIGYVAPASELQRATLIRAQSVEETPQKLPPGTPLQFDVPSGVDDRGRVRIATKPEEEGRIIHSGPVMMDPTGVPCPTCGSPQPSSGVCNSGHCWGGWSLPGCFWDDCCDTQGCSPKCFWVSAEYLLWNIKPGDVPPLVTTSSPASRGIIGNPDTSVLFGGPLTDNEDRNGGRVGFGFWCDPSHCLGLEGSFLFLGQRRNDFMATSPGSPLLARPFFDVNLGTQNSELVADPGNLAGTIQVDSSVRIWGAEANLRHQLCCNDCYKLDWIGGFRFLELDDNLSISESLGVLPTSQTGAAGAGFQVTDAFSARNFFYGGQMGLQGEVNWRRWFLNASGKLALGCNSEVVTINGQTTFIVPNTNPRYREGGLLALPTNIGRYQRNEFAVVPEVGVKLGYHVLPRLRAFVGYNVLYWSQVVRVGDTVDPVVNRSQIPTILNNGTLVGPARPAFGWRGTDFWAQGLTFGVEFVF